VSQRRRCPPSRLMLLLVALSSAAWCQESPPADSPVMPAPVAPVSVAPAPAAIHNDPFNEDRIMGVMPDYQTVRDPKAGNVHPLTSGQKWLLGWKETIDPFNLASAAITAGFSQIDNQTPKYGEGARAYSERFAAAVADFGTQNLFSAGVFANLFHQDPRYFRKGPSAKIPQRVLYSLTRLFVCQSDAGKAVFNSSGISGMVAGIAVSNLYYPAASRRGEVMAGRLETSLFGGVVGNLTSEFWPDIEKRFFKKKQK
jgi:hypothetical protein